MNAVMPNLKTMTKELQAPIDLLQNEAAGKVDFVGRIFLAYRRLFVVFIP